MEAASARAEIGYVLGRALGPGLMREALQADVRDVFDAGIVRRFEGRGRPANAASRAARLLGFSREGRLRQRWAARLRRRCLGVAGR